MLLSDRQEQILWTLEGTKSIHDHIISELRNKAFEQKRTPLIYKESIAYFGEIELIVPDNIPDEQSYRLVQYTPKSRIIRHLGYLKQGRQKIKVLAPERDPRIAIVVESLLLNYHTVRIDIPSITFFGKIPKKGKKIDQFLKEIDSNYLEKKDVNLMMRSHCGVPSFLLRSENWVQINQILRKVYGGLCRVVEHQDLLRDLTMSSITPSLPPAPKEPMPPTEKVDFIPPPDKPSPPLIPHMPTFSRETFVQKIISNYSKNSFIKIDRSRKQNSVFLIDTSGSINLGNALETIKTELKILAEAIDDQHTISLYPMTCPQTLIPFKPYIENYKKNNANDSPTELINIIESLKHETGIHHDCIYDALRYALENENLDSINILTDTAYSDTRLMKNFKNLLEITMNRRKNPVVINIYNFRNEMKTGLSYFLTKMGKWKVKGNIFLNKEVDLNLAKTCLLQLKKLNNPLEREKFLDFLKSEEITQFEKETIDYQNALDQYGKDLELYNLRLEQWKKEIDQLNQNNKSFEERMDEYEILHDEWKKEYSEWELQNTERERQKEENAENLKKAQQKFDNPKMILGYLKSILPLCTTNEEKEYFHDLIEMIQL